ncbi:hypothetical protein Gasu2_24240 [Galdieria sulphuraria]|nr:hypothetical protein Gasu2_24240 [Galdieria sulphuraria]
MLCFYQKHSIPSFLRLVRKSQSFNYRKFPFSVSPSKFTLPPKVPLRLCFCDYKKKHKLLSESFECSYTEEPLFLL